MKNWITNNFLIKTMALILAVITWFYVNGELTRQKKTRDGFYKPPTLGPAVNQPSSDAKQMNKGFIMEKK